MKISCRRSGKFLDGKEIIIYTLENEKGMKAEILNLGAAVWSLSVPDRDGACRDVVLGYENLESYFENKEFMGVIIGRHANRLQDACFELNGIHYELAKNEGNHHLHGGNKGFHKMIWEGELAGAEKDVLVLRYFSKAGEENYPGGLTVEVAYSLMPDNGLRIDYFAASDEDTVVNLTNHCYFNLSGHDAGDILRHEFLIEADCFTPIDESCLPTGVMAPVEGTPMDFRVGRTIQAGLESSAEQIIKGKGYDHNFVLNSKGDLQQKAAEVFDPVSGRKMEVYTTKPGLQFYSGNHLAGAEMGKDGVSYGKWSGFCLEAQYFPNAMKHKSFPSPILRKGEEYRRTTIYRFL